MKYSLSKQEFQKLIQLPQGNEVFSQLFSPKKASKSHHDNIFYDFYATIVTSNFGVYKTTSMKSPLSKQEFQKLTQLPLGKEVLTK